MTKAVPLILLLSYLAFVSIGLPDTVLGVAWPSLQARFVIPPSAIGAVLFSGMSGYFLSGLCAGAAVTKFGVGGLLTLSSAMVAVALLGYALAPSWAVFFSFGVVWGLGSGAIDSGLNGYAARHFSVRHVNWLHACWGIGASLSPAAMTFFIARGYGYHVGYVVLAMVLCGMTLLFSMTRQHWDETRQRSGPSEIAEGGPITSATPPFSSAPPRNVRTPSLRAALGNRIVWLQVLLFLLYTGVEATLGQWCFSWLRGRRGFAIETAGSWTSAYWASLTVGRIVLGSVVDRVGPDRMMRVSTVLALMGVTVFVYAEDLLGCLGLLLLGASLAPMFPTWMARTPARVGEGLSSHAVGLQVSASTLGAALGPSVTGLLVDRCGLEVVGRVVIAATVALLGLHEALLLFGRRPRPQLTK